MGRIRAEQPHGRRRFVHVPVDAAHAGRYGRCGHGGSGDLIQISRYPAQARFGARVAVHFLLRR